MEGIYHDGPGYRPLVLTEHWQLAQLNFAEAQRPEALTRFDQHDFTDETFTLVEGRALLLTYDEKTDVCDITPLAKNVTYNVPTMMWHNIAMEQGAIVMITESRDAHKKGCNHIPIPEKIREEIVEAAKKLWTDAEETA